MTSGRDTLGLVVSLFIFCLLILHMAVPSSLLNTSWRFFMADAFIRYDGFKGSRGKAHGCSEPFYYTYIKLLTEFCEKSPSRLSLRPSIFYTNKTLTKRTYICWDIRWLLYICHHSTNHTCPMVANALGGYMCLSPSTENIPNVKWLAGMAIYGKYNSKTITHYLYVRWVVCWVKDHYALPLCTVGGVLGQGPLRITSMYGGWCAGARTITHYLYVRWVVCWGKDHYALPLCTVGGVLGQGPLRSRRGQPTHSSRICGQWYTWHYLCPVRWV